MKANAHTHKIVNKPNKAKRADKKDDPTNGTSKHYNSQRDSKSIQLKSLNLMHHNKTLMSLNPKYYENRKFLNS